MKFEPGKTYSTRLITDRNLSISLQVVRRTDKTIWITGIRDDKKPQALRPFQYNGIEHVRPWGNFSMSPIISADDKG